MNGGRCFVAIEQNAAGFERKRNIRHDWLVATRRGDGEILHNKFSAGPGQRNRGAAGFAVTLQMSRRRAIPWRAATSCFQLPSAISTGASARPIIIDEAIMMPPEARSAITRYAPRPSIPDCNT
jgi:hypothetical protein